MYDYVIGKAADLWAGTDPSEVVLTIAYPENDIPLQPNEYLRGQVELIIEMGLAPYRGSIDGDQIKAWVARDIQRVVEENERPRLTYTRT